MTDTVENPRKRLTWALLLAGLAGVGAAGYYVNQNYDVRLVRRDAVQPAPVVRDAAAVPAAQPVTGRANKPAPIVVRLACVDAGATIRGLKSPSRSLRDQLRNGDRKAPTPLPGKRCKPSAATLSGFNRDMAALAPQAGS